MIEAQGVGAKVIVNENSVRVEETGFGARGAVDIPFNKINKIRWVSSHIFARGNIQFFSDSVKTRSVIFKRTQQEQIEKIKQHVLDKASALSDGVTLEDKSTSPVTYGIVLSVMVAVIAFFVVSMLTDSEDTFTDIDAHTLCDNAIKSASLNSDLVKIPFKAARETDNAYGFLWRREDGLKMHNAFGAQIDAVVICRVSKHTQRIEHLEINGEVLSPR